MHVSKDNEIGSQELEVVQKDDEGLRNAKTCEPQRDYSDVGGYFSHENSCRELCANNFGMRNCLGYAYEPESRGKCTLLERINLIRASDPGKTTRLVVKC
ncbi:hypothetical protein PRIPAC_74848 [Pristionchus pacificus]|uniref:Uncharacterized protein n=1 Tax=Pristionchus pacificus TaxID=54126 RepID=A0A2A6B5C8_PRIPA|nr:hypothetical protein PRIPAC_74848 [Pristionchus pacificus]|eukprot:PDM61082.1 hypothetical protein PRIPAC_54888 [Pristionchus pacificus]